jgi:hypothetical protein
MQTALIASPAAGVVRQRDGNAASLASSRCVADRKVLTVVLGRLSSSKMVR